MEKQPGVMLNDMWDNMEGSQKAEIARSLILEKERWISTVGFCVFPFPLHDLDYAILIYQPRVYN